MALQNHSELQVLPVRGKGTTSGRKFGPFGQIQSLNPLSDGTFLITSTNSDHQTIGSVIDPQGQRTSNLVNGKDFRKEVRAIAAPHHFAANAIIDGMTLEEGNSEAP
jgi:hypothetical protein